VVGAALEDSSATSIDGDQGDNSAPSAGAVYVFTRSGTVWSQQAYLKASNTDESDFFGWSVAISGDTLVVGANGEDSDAASINGDENDNSAEDSGAAYAFTRDGTQWTQQAYLKASNNDILDQFGFSVAISGDTAVVGAGLEDSSATGINGDQDDNSAINAGAAYVFTRSGSTVWSQQAYLKASNTDAGDNFGAFMALFGDKLIAGAYPEDSSAMGIDGNQSDNSAVSAGAAYVFTRNGTLWGQKAYLKAPNTDADDGFGHSVAVSDDILVVGVLFEDSNATGINADQSDNSAQNSGAAFVFDTLPDFTINSGYSGAWFNPHTSGQGQMVDVVAEEQFMFLSWFTFTDDASDNPFEQHWFTAQGNYSGNEAELILYETLGGRFDDKQEVNTKPVGAVTLKFSDCGHGQLSYNFTGEDVRGSFPLLRAIPGSDTVCEDLSGANENATETVSINDGMDGVWFDDSTPGQGFMIDAQLRPERGNFIFVGWFTYGEQTTSGQRWLTAQGGFEGSTAEMDVFETSGGSFDDPQLPATTLVGTMRIDFIDCSHALLAYSLSDEGLAGSIDIERAIPGAEALCQELSGQIE
jgi:hypothetical protein